MNLWRPVAAANPAIHPWGRGGGRASHRERGKEAAHLRCAAGHHVEPLLRNTRGLVTGSLRAVGRLRFS